MISNVKSFFLKGVFAEGITESTLEEFLKSKKVAEIVSLKLCLKIPGDTMKAIIQGLNNQNFKCLNTLMISLSD